jgi:hypothetical protein
MTTWTVGDVRITKVVEHELPIPLEGLLVGVPEETARLDWLAPFLTPEGDADPSLAAMDARVDAVEVAVPGEGRP